MSLNLSNRLEISRHADLKTRQDGAVLVLPERAIRIGGSGEEILRLVFQGRSGESVLATMCERYSGSSEVAAEVLGFLEEMLSLGGIIECEQRAGKTS